MRRWGPPRDVRRALSKMKTPFYQEGKLAYLKGLKSSDNPYSGEEYSLWAAGWKEGSTWNDLGGGYQLNFRPIEIRNHEARGPFHPNDEYEKLIWESENVGIPWLSQPEPQARKKRHRKGIPSDVRKAIWERDKGKCRKCGATEALHLDHIIPVSKGGSSAMENIELLCQECNLKKSDNIE